MRRALLFTLALALPSTGCLAAAAAGAAGGIYLTSRGAESVVEGSVDQVAGRAAAVMTELGIVKGDLDVDIEIRRESPTTTKVEVTARKNLAEWDKEYAKEVLSRIVQRG